MASLRSDVKDSDANTSSTKMNSNGVSQDFPPELYDQRILLASESLGPINGVSRTTSSLILSLQHQEIPMKLVAPHYSRTKAPLPIGPVRRLGGAPLPYTPELTVAYPFRLDRICHKFKPSIIYLASPASVGYQVLLQLRCMPNPPIVMANFQTDLSAYSEIILPSPLGSYSAWMLQKVEGYLYNFNAVHTIFYPSMPVYHYLVSAGVPAKKLVRLGRGVDTNVFNASHRDDNWRRQLAPNGEVILVCVGRLAPEKGFPFLAKVAIRMHELGLPFKLLLVGGNKNPAVEESIRSAFKPVADRVVFTGFLEGAALARAYATADVFVHCSVTETFGLVVLEAMACGLPVVARDAGGPSEIVREGQSGFLTPPEDLAAFVDRVTQLTTNAALRARMSDLARSQAEDTTWEKINLRVAQRMATAVRERAARRPRRSLDLGYQALNWIAALFAAVWTELKFTGAMVVVSMVWVVVVVPLLVHGNVMFSGSRKTAAVVSTGKSSGAKVGVL